MRWLRSIGAAVKVIQEQGGVAVSVAWSAITGKPTEFPPSYHTHSQYLTTETDPTVPVHVKGISEEQIVDWDSPEIDPTVPEHVKLIQQSDIDFWNSACWRRLWVERDKPSYTGDVTFSIIGATQAQKKLAAYTIQDGTAVRIRAVGTTYYPGGLYYVNLTIGDYADYNAPFYFTINNDTTEFVVGTMAYELEVEIVFGAPGATADANICATLRISDSSSEALVYARRSVGVLAVDTTDDLYLDIVINPGDPTTSIYPQYSIAEILR